MKTIYCVYELNGLDADLVKKFASESSAKEYTSKTEDCFFVPVYLTDELFYDISFDD